MNTTRLRSLLIALPALAVTTLWVASSMRPELLFSAALEPLYYLLIGASLLSLGAAIWHFFAAPRSVGASRPPDAILCLVVNVIALLANLYGFGLLIQQAVGRLL